MKFRRTSVVAAAAAMTLALVACAPEGDATPGDTTPDDTSPVATTPEGNGIISGPFGGDALSIGEPQQGGSATIALSHAVPHLDPAEAIGASLELVARAVFGRLLEVQPDGLVGEGLALGVATEDNTEWTLTLRDGLTFSDGTPFDAEAVIAHIESVGAEGSTSLSADAARGVESMEAVDEVTVEFTLAAPNSQFDLHLADGSMAMVGGPEDANGQKVGAGPFVIESFTPEGTIELSRNGGYFDDALPYLDAIRLEPVLDATSRIAGITAGDLDAATLTSLDALSETDDLGITSLVQPSYEQFFFQPNLESDGPVSDVRVRTAINHAIDREAINAVVYDGTHVPSEGLFAPQHPYFEDSGWPLYDPDAAESLVEEYVADTGSEIAITLMVNQEPVSSEIAALLQQQLGQVGISLTPEVSDPTTQISNVLAGTFDALLMPRTWQAETTSILSESFGAGYAFNFGRGSDPSFEDLIDRVSTSTSDEERVALIPEMLETLTEWVPTAPIISTGVARLASNRITHFPDGDPNARSSEVYDLALVAVAD